MPRRVPVLTPEMEAAQLRDKLCLAEREIASRDVRIAELEELLATATEPHQERRPRR